MVIGVDFDGTICQEGYYPDIGPELPGAIETLKWLNSKGVKIILYTIRSHEKDKDYRHAESLPSGPDGQIRKSHRARL